MPKPSFSFDHLHIVCLDLETMVDFWTTALGCKLVERRPFDTAAGAVIEIGGVALYLRLPKAEERLDPPPQNTFGYHHVGLITDNFTVAVSRLIDYGCQVLSGNVAGTTMFLRGPEGIVIELKKRT
jgi:catechol 2,3-dioxygenase-like lactoylglutathione lyase family enzyme